MTVIFLSATGQVGGAETSLLDVLASLRRAEPSWTLHLIVPSPGPLDARAAALGIETMVLPFPGVVARLGEAGARGSSGYSRLIARLAIAAVPTAAYVARLRRVIHSIAPDIVHTNGLKPHLLAGWASSRPALVWHLHDYLGSRPMTARLLRRNVGRCGAVVANSESVAMDARAALGSGTPIAVVHNGVDLDRFSPCGERADLDALAHLTPAPAGTIRIGLLGTFARWKGHVVLLRALARLPGDAPLRAYVIGDAVYQTDASQYSREELASEAERVGIGERVGFCGYVDRPERALRSLDIVVHASTAPEPFGLAIVEAMACGRAVIASVAGGAAEIVTPEHDALAHQPGDVEALAVQLRRLIGDASLRARLGQAARTTAERRFDRARLAQDLVPVYRRLAPSA
jgi:glycosyltransferase involved in cell wall biosynthesis